MDVAWDDGSDSNDEEIVKAWDRCRLEHAAAMRLQWLAASRRKIGRLRQFWAMLPIFLSSGKQFGLAAEPVHVVSDVLS